MLNAKLFLYHNSQVLHNLLETAAYLAFLFSQRNVLKLIDTQNFRGVE